MTETLSFDFCDISIFDNYLIVVMKEGVNITPDYNAILENITKKYFSKTSFVYITNRVNSYSVDPKIYYETAKIENLKGFAVVASNYQAKINAEIEKMFFNKPFKLFDSVENAIHWAKEITDSSN